MCNVLWHITFGDVGCFVLPVEDPQVENSENLLDIEKNT